MNATNKTCDYCGRDLPQDSEPQPDPYAAELFDDRTLVWICDQCYHERAMEV